MSKSFDFSGGRYIVDTNLFLKWMLPSEKSSLSSRQRSCLSSLFFTSKQIYVTPYVLAEVSNLLKIRGGIDLEHLRSKKKSDFSILSSALEEYVSKDKILGHKNISFGVTDISLLELSKQKGFSILTDEKPLYNLCLSEDVSAVSFDSLVYQNIT